MLITCQKRNRALEKANNTRKSGWVPAVIYGKEIGSIPISVPGKEALQLYRSGDLMVDVKIEGVGQYKANLRNSSRHPMTGILQHLSLFQVQANKPIDMNIPIKIVGVAPGIKQGGVVNHHLSTLSVTCLPKDVVNEIQIDVSNLQLDGTIHMEEIPLPPGLSLQSGVNLKLVVIDCYQPEEVNLIPDNAPVVAEAADGAAAAADGEKAAAADGGEAKKAPEAAEAKKADKKE